MIFEKLDMMGSPVAKVNDTTSHDQKNQTKLVGVLYGHTKGGKVYNYKANGNFRTGDTVTPEVTHYKNPENTYHTLGRIVSTQNMRGSPAGHTLNHLNSMGVGLKTLEKTDQQSLPGFKARKEKDENFTVTQWAEEAKERERASVEARMQRRNALGDTIKDATEVVK